MWIMNIDLILNVDILDYEDEKGKCVFVWYRKW